MTERGFPREEFEARAAAAQALMAQAGLAALLLTTEPEIRYFTGFLTRFWESPTRPWFLILPAAGAPIAVIPSIGARLMGETWISDIRTWRSPDDADDGIGLLAETLREAAPSDARIGAPSGPETHLRLPLESWRRLGALIGAERLISDAGILRRLRMVKSEREIAKIRAACAAAGRAFARLPDVARAGDPLEAVFRRFQGLCLEEGADWVAYLAGAAGPGGYGDVISPATERPIAAGDALTLDVGAVWDGYFCDFDRNFSVGPPAPALESAYARLLDAAQAGFAAARPGAAAADLHDAMRAALGPDDGASRLGHGLGMQLTEPPSLLPADQTILAPGMALTLEPGLTLSADRMLVHEENIVIREHGAEWLSPPAPRRLPVLETTL